MKYLLLIFIICFLRFIDGQGKTSEEFGDDVPLNENESVGSSDAPDSEDEGDEGSQDISFSSKEFENGKAPYFEEKLKQNDNVKTEIDPETIKLFLSEVAAGERSDLIGQNQHIKQSPVYHDLGRRFNDQQGKTSEEFDDDVPLNENESVGSSDAPDSDDEGDEGSQDISFGSKEFENGKAPYFEEQLKQNDNVKTEIDPETIKLFLSEVAAGERSDLIGQNQHIKQSPVYHDLGRRFNDQALKNNVTENDDRLTPEKAPPELVLLVAKESALLRTGKDNEFDHFDQEKILRSGDYWDGVWKEEVIPKSPLRSTTEEKKLGSIKAKINPGTEFYKVVSRMKKISPQLLYIVNKHKV